MGNHDRTADLYTKRLGMMPDGKQLPSLTALASLIPATWMLARRVLQYPLRRAAWVHSATAQRPSPNAAIVDLLRRGRQAPGSPPELIFSQSYRKAR
jgi:hypothetical protein